MRISVKIRSESGGRVVPIDVEGNDSLRVLRQKVTENIGTSDFQLFLGATELAGPQNTSLTALGIVNGDRLFLTLGASATVTVAAPPETSSSVPEKVTSPDEESMEDEEGEDGQTFRDRVNRSIRDHMDDSQFSNESLQSWSSPVTCGTEMRFSARPSKKSKNIRSELISVLVTVLTEPNISAVVTVFRITDATRFMIESFPVSQSNVAGLVANGLSKALIHSGLGTASLPQLLQVSLIRNAILGFLPAETTVRLGATNRLTATILKSKEVDQDYWRKKLNSDFGVKSRGSCCTYRARYAKEADERKKSGRVAEPLFVPDRQPRVVVPPDFVPPRPWGPEHPGNPYPLLPYPHGPAPDPLQPIPDPLRPIQPDPERGQPFGPRFPGGPAPAPWDPNNGGEVLPGQPRMPRGPRRLGDPFAPSNPFDHFDRNDFI